MNIDIAMIKSIAELLIELGIPLCMVLWGIWKREGTIQSKIEKSVPHVWGATQQALRKNDGKLPNGQKPLDYSLDLLSKIVKLDKRQRALAEAAIKSYHEHQGAPSSDKPVKPVNVVTVSGQL